MLEAAPPHSIFMCMSKHQSLHYKKEGTQAFRDDKKLPRLRVTFSYKFKEKVSVLLPELKACTISNNLQNGTRIHAVVICSNDKSIIVATTLVHMYAKCGSILDAHRVFNAMQYHDLGSWNALIFGYAEIENSEFAFSLFGAMQNEGFMPNGRTYVAILKACASCGSEGGGNKIEQKSMEVEFLEKGIAIHSQLQKNGYELHIFVASTLVDMYAKCGSMVHAHRVFDKMSHRSVVTWNILIFGYARHGDCDLALQLVLRMKDDGLKPNSRTYVAVLKACATCAATEEGKKVEEKIVKRQSLEIGMAIHSEVAKDGFELEVFVASMLIDMYAKCGSVLHARDIFNRMLRRSVVTWNAMIFGYIESGEYELALQMFEQMQNEGFLPDGRTYVSALKACAGSAVKEDANKFEGKLLKVEHLEKGRAIHSQLSKDGYGLDIFVANTLVDMYSKCGSMEHAHIVFDSMYYHDIVSWNAIIFGYADSAENNLVLQLFTRMVNEGFSPNALTYIAVLKACSCLGALEIGKQIHVKIRNVGLQEDLLVASSLVDFYSKCGSMVDAQHVFDSMATRDLVTWNMLLAGYANHGNTKRVFNLFAIMVEELQEADNITFLAIFAACNHSGLIDRGKEYFWAMCMWGIITPTVEHYACIVDLLGRGNLLDDTLAVARDMPFEPDMMIWARVLSVCPRWDNMAAARPTLQS